MRTVKVIGLGILFSLVGFVMLLVISIMRSGVSVETGPSHATALSAVVGGLIEALFSPLTLLVMVIGFGAAMWVTRKTKSPFQS